MMKRRKLVAMAAVAVMVFNVTGSVYAASTPREVPVTYDNTLIPDPENPGTPTWGVALPGKIMFSDNKKTISGLDVELKGMNGHDLAGDLKVNVSVTSANSYSVKYNDAEVAYTLTYDSGTALSGAGANTLDVLTAASPKREGTAVLTGTATEQGAYSDTLTYKVEKDLSTM